MRKYVVFILFVVFFMSVYAQYNKKKYYLWKEHLLGNIKEITETSYDAKDVFGEIQKKSITYKSIDKFDIKGNLIESDYYDNFFKDKHELKEIFRYDKTGHRIEQNNYKLDGSLENKFIFKYDDKGNQIEYASYDSDGSLMDKNIYKYDNQGNQIECAYYHSDGSLINKSTYNYDNKGNEIEMNTYNTSGSLEFRYIYKYDNKGNETEYTTYNSDGSLTGTFTWKYKYDIKGNWNESIKYKNTIPIIINEREITYY